MAFKLASAFVDISTRMGGLSSGLRAARGLIGSVLGGVTGMIGRLGAMAAGVGTLLGGISLAAAVHAGAAQEELDSMFEAVFQSGTEDAKKFADELGKSIGRGVGDLMEQMAGFQDLFVPLGFARDDAKELSKQLVTLVQDVSSFKNANPADVARDFNSALVGNAETVRKYGIVITQAALDNELLAMGIAKGVKGATEQEKVQARLNMIMKGTTDAQGDAVRTAGSFTNRLRGLQGVIKDTLGIIGSGFLPALGTIASVATESIRSIQPALEHLADQFAKWSMFVLNNWRELWPLVVDVAKLAFSKLPELWAFAHGRMARHALSAMESIIKFFVDSYKHFFSWAERRYAQMFENIAAFVQGRDPADLIGDTKSIMAKFEAMGRAAKLGFEGEWSDVSKLFTNDPAFKKLQDKASKLFENAFKPDPEKTKEAVEKSLDVAGGAASKGVKVALEGLFSFEQANKGLQEALLKQNSPQQQLVGLGEAQKNIQGQMLAGINQLVTNTAGTTMIPVATGGAT